MDIVNPNLKISSDNLLTSAITLAQDQNNL